MCSCVGVYIQKPGYYVNIVWLKSSTPHNWLHTHARNMHTQTNSVVCLMLSFPLSCHAGWQEHWNIVMFPDIHTLFLSLSLSFCFVAGLGHLRKMSIRLLNSHGSCSLLILLLSVKSYWNSIKRIVCTTASITLFTRGAQLFNELFSNKKNNSNKLDKQVQFHH